MYYIKHSYSDFSKILSQITTKHDLAYLFMPGFTSDIVRDIQSQSLPYRKINLLTMPTIHIMYDALSLKKINYRFRVDFLVLFITVRTIGTTKEGLNTASRCS